MLNNAYKPYPCGVVLFPVIDACLELRARLAPKTEVIDRVVVRGHPLMRERTDRPNVKTGRDARVSLQHTLAAAFLLALPGSSIRGRLRRRPGCARAARKPSTRRPAYAPHAPHGKGSAVGTGEMCARIAAPRASRRRPG